MVKFTERDIAIIAGTAGVLDFLTEGRFSAPVARALKKAMRRFGPPVVSATARTIPRLAGTALRGARFVAMRHPYIAAAVVTYEVIKNREQIAQLLGEGWEVIEPAAEAIYDVAEPTGIYDIRPGARPSGVGAAIAERLKFKMPKRKSQYSKAMSSAMKAVKASSKGGKKGTLSNPKKTFGTVSKTVSKIMRGGTRPRSGIGGIISRAVRGTFKKLKQKRKKKRTSRYR